MMIIRLLLCATSFLLVSALISCNMVDAKPEAEAVAAAAFSARASLDRDQALSLYGKAFYEATSRSEWSELLDALERKLGVPESHSLQSWKVFVGAKPSGTGTYVTLSYKVDYSKSSGEETFVMFTPAIGGKPKIIGHHFNSAALLAD